MEDNLCVVCLQSSIFDLQSSIFNLCVSVSLWLKIGCC